MSTNHECYADEQLRVVGDILRVRTSKIRNREITAIFYPECCARFTDLKVKNSNLDMLKIMSDVRCVFYVWYVRNTPNGWCSLKRGEKP